MNNGSEQKVYRRLKDLENVSFQEEVCKRLEDIYIEVGSDFNTDRFSLLNDYQLTEKFIKESDCIKENQESLEELMNKILEVSDVATKEGLLAIPFLLYNTVDDFFFKNMMYIFSEKWNPPTVSGRILYWAKPFLLAKDFVGIDYIKAFIICEAMLMLNLGSDYIKYCLLAILGNRVLAESIIK